MRKMLLLKSQANAVFEAIRGADLDPSEFEWEEIPCTVGSIEEKVIVSELVHKPTRYFFEFGLRSDLPYALYSPDRDGAGPGSAMVGGWAGLRVAFESWVGYLRREVLAPDLWASVSQARQLTDAASTEEPGNAAFRESEQKEISAALHEIKQFLFTTQSLTDEHRKFVTGRLDYLEASSKRMGRKDWFNLTAGVLLSIVVQIGLQSQAASELFRLAGNLLHNLFGGGPLALP